MDTITVKTVREISLEELLQAKKRITTAQVGCLALKAKYDIHAVDIATIDEELQRREDKQRFGAMFAQKPINREDDGDILFA